MQISLRLLVFLTAFNALSAEFELANRFLDAYPLSSCDGKHEEDVLQNIHSWAKSDNDENSLKGSFFAFSGLQVLRGTKLVAFISPVVLHNGQQFDLRHQPIWQQMVENAKLRETVKIVEYVANVNVLVNTPKGPQQGIFQSPSYVIINTAHPKSNEIINYFVDGKRNANFHPGNDIHFVMEGYLLGYVASNVEAYYSSPQSNRKLPLDKVHPAAKVLLNKYVVSDVSELESAPGKFLITPSHAD